MDKNSGPATGTSGIEVTASALEKPGTWVRLPASVRFFYLFRCVLSSIYYYLLYFFNILRRLVSKVANHFASHKVAIFLGLFNSVFL